MVGAEDHRLLQLAEGVRSACLAAAREAYREASVSGLCREGAEEAALGAIEMVSLLPIIQRFTAK